MRKFKIFNGEYYHIYNRGVDKRDIYLNDFDYSRFIKVLQFMNCTSRVINFTKKTNIEAKPRYNCYRLCSLSLLLSPFSAPRSIS